MRDDPGDSSPGAPESRTELLTWQMSLNELVDDFSGPQWFSASTDPRWTVPHDVVPTTLYFDVTDNRSGRAFAELHFVPDPAQ